MAKYIDADVLMEYLKQNWEPINDSFPMSFSLNQIKDSLDEMPAADVEPVERWISVDERLPEARKDCLVYVRCSGFMGMYGCWIKIGHTEKADGEWWGDCMCGKVLYWQYLPEPPKMDGGSE